MPLAPVVPLREAPSLADIVGRLRHFADRLEKGEEPMPSTLLIAAAYPDGSMGQRCFGDNPQRSEVVGLFQMAAFDAALRNFENAR